MRVLYVSTEVHPALNTGGLAEGNFVWVTGEPTAYTFWAPGEPNDGGQSGEDCALTNRAGQAGRWDDRPCAMNYAFVCERLP